MSSWKKAAKVNQKVHRERHQPEARKHLGLLEKHKDYQNRAKDYNEKKDTLKLLRKKALNKNPDEFYYHMINSKTENGIHFEKETEAEDTPEQIKLMRTQDLKYIVTKRTQEQRKIEKLQSQLHLIDLEKPVNKHKYLDKELKKTSGKEPLIDKELPDIDTDLLQASAKKRTALYRELHKRIERENQLAVIQRKIEMKRAVEAKSGLPPKRIRKGNQYTPPQYVWKYERKK